MSVSTDSIGASIINSLGNGSGINIDELATNLTNAETAAAKAALEASVEKTELKISGYSYIKAQTNLLFHQSSMGYSLVFYITFLF